MDEIILEISAIHSLPRCTSVDRWCVAAKRSALNDWHVNRAPRPVKGTVVY